jgi:hypothetical protein
VGSGDKIKVMVAHSHCPYYYLPPITQLIVSEHHKLRFQNFGLKFLGSYKVTLALGKAGTYEGQYD